MSQRLAYSLHYGGDECEPPERQDALALLKASHGISQEPESAFAYAISHPGLMSFKSSCSISICAQTRGGLIYFSFFFGFFSALPITFSAFLLPSSSSPAIHFPLWIVSKSVILQLSRTQSGGNYELLENGEMASRNVLPVCFI